MSVNIKNITVNIPGFPISIGDRVKVLSNPNNDLTFDDKYSNKIGSVIYFNFNCGCGQSYPKDPMIGVRFIYGQEDEFWKEELKIYSTKIGC